VFSGEIDDWVTQDSRQCWHWHRVVRVGWSLQTYLQWGRVLTRVLHAFMRCGKGGHEGHGRASE